MEAQISPSDGHAPPAYHVFGPQSLRSFRQTERGNVRNGGKVACYKQHRVVGKAADAGDSAAGVFTFSRFGSAQKYSPGNTAFPAQAQQFLQA